MSQEELVPSALGSHRLARAVVVTLRDDDWIWAPTDDEAEVTVVCRMRQSAARSYGGGGAPSPPPDGRQPVRMTGRPGVAYSASRRAHSCCVTPAARPGWAPGPRHRPTGPGVGGRKNGGGPTSNRARVSDAAATRSIGTTRTPPSSLSSSSSPRRNVQFVFTPAARGERGTVRWAGRGGKTTAAVLPRRRRSTAPRGRARAAAAARAARRARSAPRAPRA